MKFQIDDLVFTPFKNRWDLFCVGTIRNVREDGTYDVEVWNRWGPGANSLVKGMPENELKPS